MEAKPCIQCGETKPLTDYYRKLSGYQSWCKPCGVILQRERHRAKQAKLTGIVDAWSAERYGDRVKV